MKIEDAKKIIEGNPDKPMSAIWSRLLKDSWQEGLFEVQNLIESVSVVDLSLWVLQSDVPELQVAADLISRRFQVSEEVQSQDLAKIFSKTVNKEKKEILEKIFNIADDRGLDLLDFLSEVKSSTNLASQVQKNATKKGLYEPAAAAFIQVRSIFDVLVLAHAENKLSIRFSGMGKVGINRQAADPYSKDADIVAFSFKGSLCSAYLISHKYARVGGGHQMNQRADAAKFLAYANEALLRDEPLDPLRELIQTATGRTIAREDFSWQPALILDGEFFANAPAVIRAEESYPALSNTTLFIGSVDDFVGMASVT